MTSLLTGGISSEKREIRAFAIRSTHGFVRSRGRCERMGRGERRRCI